MSGKRPLEDEGSVSDDHVAGRLPSKRPLLRNEASESDGHELRQLTRTLSPIIRGAAGLRQLCRLVNDSPTLVESLLRGMVQDEVKNVTEKHGCEPPGIEGEGNEPVQLVMINSETKEIVRSGHLSSAWTKLCVLDGGFDKYEQGCFTRKEFDSSIIRPREGKGQLLTGVIKKQLKNGVGLFNDIRINDISHCTTNGKFKLGASVERSKHPAETVTEAASKSFIVKDRRLKSSEKPAFPDLTDGVGCLKNIGAIFLGRLHAAHIKTVLGGRMSNNKWEETVAHAQKCNTLCPKILVQESSQFLPELPESIVECSDSLLDGPTVPSQQDSLVPRSELGELGAPLDVPSFNNHGEVMPGTSQPNNVSVMGGSLQSQIFNPFQGNTSNTIMEDASQANSTATTQDTLLRQSLSPTESDYLLRTDYYHGGYGCYGHEFRTGASILSSEVGEPSHRYANDQMAQDGEADLSHSLLNAAGETKRRRWLKVRAVLKLTTARPIVAS
ncbi:hypothetical protein ACLOJK_026381 [Asimina triloba]